MGLIDWAADKVQSITGEKERRRLVQSLKDNYIAFKDNVKEKVNFINYLIERFNNTIRQLNNIRSTQVIDHIVTLSKFLSLFGNVKPIESYAPEEDAPPVKLPNRDFEKIESYIQEVDWSKEDVFINTFFLSPIGMTIKTKKQNLSLNERIHEFKLMAEETIRELDLRALGQTNQNTAADLYYECVTFIVKTIDNKIIPELNLIEEFFQAQEIKEHVIVQSNQTELTSNINIALLQNTQYMKHYTFVKNVFAFYVISCRIYNTPVLTRLIQGKYTDADKKQLLLEKNSLYELEKQLSDVMFLSVGG